MQNNGEIMRKIIAILAFVAFAFVANAQLLWKVTGNGAQKPSYVFGTYHLAPEAFIDSVPGLPQAIDEVSEVWVEVVADSLMSGNVQKMMLKEMIAPADSTIDKLVSPEGFNIIDAGVKRYLGAFGVGLKDLKQLKPAALVNQIQVLQSTKLVKDFKMGNMLDGGVERRVTAAGKPSHGLESADQQIDILFNYPLQEQAAELLDLCKDLDEAERIQKELIDAYMKQDLARVEKLFDESNEGDSEERLDEFIYGRNRNWMATLVPLMKQKNVIVAVGAAHLCGEKGILALLRKAGYTVEPVK